MSGGVFVYLSPFGMTGIGPDVPEHYHPEDGSMDAQIGKVYEVGGTIESPTVLTERPWVEDEKVVGSIKYLSVPFRGSFLHEVARERRS